MGLLQGTNVTWLQAKNGAIFHWNKEKKENEKYYGIEGVIQSIYIKNDEFEGREIPKCHVKLVDSDGVVFDLSWTYESWFTHGFFSAILGADLSKNITIGASGSEQNEKVTFCWMKQGGNSTLKKDENFPKPEKKESRGKVSYDYDAMLDACDKIIEKFSGTQLQPSGKDAQVAKAEAEPETDDSIPF